MLQIVTTRVPVLFLLYTDVGPLILSYAEFIADLYTMNAVNDMGVFTLCKLNMAFISLFICGY